MKRLGPLSQKVIVIDPGHGGTSKAGGSSPNNAEGPVLHILEKNVSLEISKSVQGRKNHNNWTVILTRSEDVNLSLSNRAGVARVAIADIFISIHFNATPDPDDHITNGTEVWVWDDKSNALANKLLLHICAITGNTRRGVKQAHFGVLDPKSHHPDTVPVLVEVSFLSCAAEELRLCTAEYKQSITEAIIAAIDDYFTAEDGQ